jgi:hypothetical protein
VILASRIAWLGCGPQLLKAGEVRGDHVAALKLVEAGHGRMSRGDAVRMLVDQMPPVCAR